MTPVTYKRQLIPFQGLLLTLMSYYAGQQGQGGQYPDDYAAQSAPPTPRDPNYQPQWEQQQESQHSQHSQMSEQMSQQALEQSQQHHSPLSLPSPQLQQSLYHQQLEDPRHLVPSQIPPRGTHDETPIRLLPVSGQPPVRSAPVEIKPVMLQVDTAVRSTSHAGPSTRPASRARPHQYHPYPRPSSASGSTAAALRREIEAHHHVRFASQTNTPQASAMHSPASARQTFASPMRCAARFAVFSVVSPAVQ